MFCEECKKRPATIHIVQTINNQKIEKYLCEQCAHKSDDIKFSLDNKFSVQDLLKGIISHGVANIPKVQADNPCPGCGMTYGDFSRYGKIGCSECFATYGDRLEPLLRRIHGASAHTGKVPRRSGDKLAVKQRIRKLRCKLDHHVGREEYEQAAKVRDEIKSLEKELSD